jgi:hypothetical protein
MKIKIALILLALLCAVACKKDAVDENKNFIGTWSSICAIGGFTQIITIDSNSYGAYQEYADENATAGFKGTARANRKKLKIGDIFHFNIIQPPTEIDTNSTVIYIYYPGGEEVYKKATWSMTLSEAYPAFYLRGNVTYYKADY